MAIIYTYPTKNAVAADKVLISDSADELKTKQAPISSIKDAIDVVDSIVAGSGISVSSATGNVTISTPVYSGGNNIGHVPTGGSATTFLRGDGSWIVPTNTTYEIMGSGNSYAAGLVLAGNATHGDNFLRKDGTWASPPSGTPGTPLNSIQFNNASSFSGDSGFIFTNAGAAPKLTIGDTSSDVAGMIEIQSDENGGVLKIGGGSQAYYASIKGSENDTANYDIILPTAGPGGNNKILESDSTGQLSWVNSSTGVKVGFSPMSIYEGEVEVGTASAGNDVTIARQTVVENKCTITGVQFFRMTGDNEISIHVYEGTIANPTAANLVLSGTQAQSAGTVNSINEIGFSKTGYQQHTFNAGTAIIIVVCFKATEGGANALGINKIQSTTTNLSALGNIYVSETNAMLTYAGLQAEGVVDPNEYGVSMHFYDKT